MKTKWLENEFKYDGLQLKPLVNYLQHGILGDSCVAWVGPCDIPFAHMMDGEDLLQKSQIRGAKMLHFVFEVFDRELVTGVFLQRLFASVLQDIVYEKTQTHLSRDGDDLFLKDAKLSISIATRSSTSVLVHFALNVTNEGTPVKTCSLKDLGLDPRSFADEALSRVALEYDSILKASRKVRTF